MWTVISAFVPWYVPFIRFEILIRLTFSLFATSVESSLDGEGGVTGKVELIPNCRLS